MGCVYLRHFPLYMGIASFPITHTYRLNVTGRCKFPSGVFPLTHPRTGAVENYSQISGQSSLALRGLVGGFLYARLITMPLCILGLRSRLAAYGLPLPGTLPRPVLHPPQVSAIPAVQLRRLPRVSSRRTLCSVLTRPYSALAHSLVRART